MHENAYFLAIYRHIWCNNRYITDHLDPTNYLLNFGITAINELCPKVIIRFTLKNIRNDLTKSWTQAIEGEMLEDLFDCVYPAVEMQKKLMFGNFICKL